MKNREEFAANMIGTTVLCLLDKFSKSEVKEMLRTKKTSKLVDYLSDIKGEVKQ